MQRSAMETVGGAEPGAGGQRAVTTRTRWVRTHGVGVALLLLLMVWLGVSLWAAPVPATGVALKAAADHGQITGLTRLGSPPSRLSSDPMFLFRHDDSMDASGAFLVWTTSNGHRYFTDATTVSGPFPDDGEVTSGSMFSGDGSNPSPVDRVTAYVLRRTQFHGGLVWSGITQLALFVFAIGSIRGRAPWRGTRWFWFWVINLPLGVGVAWFAISERLRDPAPVRERWSGPQGFACSIVGLAVIQLAVGAGHVLFARL